MQRGHCWCVDELGLTLPSHAGGNEGGALPCDGEWDAARGATISSQEEEEEEEGRGVRETGGRAARAATLPGQETPGEKKPLNMGNTT